MYDPKSTEAFLDRVDFATSTIERALNDYLDGYPVDSDRADFALATLGYFLEKIWV